MTLEETKKEIKKIVFRHISPKEYKVFLYGSRVAGGARKWSDYDVGIWGKRPIPTMVKFEIEDELENSDLPVVVEVVDFCNVGEGFKQLAMQRVEQWQ